MATIANKNARRYVENLQPFTGSNLWAEQRGEFYVVFSYRYTWPLVVFDGTRWHINTEKYSVSTSRHLSQCRPLKSDPLERNTAELRQLINI